MKFAQLGRSGLKVSKLCLGTMNFGNFTEEKECFRIMDAALEAGINFFDTADNYGLATKNWGITEKIIGRWFKQGGGRRESVVLATKVHEDMFDPQDGPNSAGGLSLYKVRRHLQASLDRLQTDHLEIYYMHHIDRNVTWDEMWGAFIPLVEKGIVDYVGSSNFAAWNLAQAQEEAKARRFFGIICEEHKYNLMCRLPELEVLPCAQNYGMGVVAYSPLQSGLLNGNALRPQTGSRSAKRNTTEIIKTQLEAFSKHAAELGESESNIALAWLLGNQAVTAPIIGPRTLEQLNSTLRAIDIELTPEMATRLDEIFPGPGGAAPEAYAW